MQTQKRPCWVPTRMAAARTFAVPLPVSLQLLLLAFLAAWCLPP